MCILNDLPVLAHLIFSMTSKMNYDCLHFAVQRTTAQRYFKLCGRDRSSWSWPEKAGCLSGGWAVQVSWAQGCACLPERWTGFQETLWPIYFHTVAVTSIFFFLLRT